MAMQSAACLRRLPSAYYTRTTQQANPLLSLSTHFYYQNTALQSSFFRFSSSKSAHHRAPRQARAFPPAIAAAIALGGFVYYLSTPSTPQSDVLNKDTFVPYTITSRQIISPTSLIITVTPHNASNTTTYLVPESSEWRFPLWSVEFKQPEVQIARHYTPLPPLDDEDPSDGKLRFYVRAVPGGEMSGYLNRLGVGKSVWLRGPHTGFDILSRLGEQPRSVVFLAGGTGIVPGMQVAKSVLDSNVESTVDLLWAIRQRSELQGVTGSQPTPLWQSFWRKANEPIEIGSNIQSPSPIGTELALLKATYGDRLKIKVAIDEEQTSFRSQDLQAVIQSTAHNIDNVKDEAGKECRLHNQTLHTQSSEFEDPGIPCLCDQKSSSSSGKNLLMVSGPEGFISHFVGPKVWLNGIETQGPIGGNVGAIRSSNSNISSAWIVLKL